MFIFVLIHPSWDTYSMYRPVSVFHMFVRGFPISLCFNFFWYGKKMDSLIKANVRSQQPQWSIRMLSGSGYERHRYLPRKNNILTADIPGATCSLLAHENLSCQAVKGEPASTNISDWLTDWLRSRVGGGAEKMKPPPVYWLLLSKRRKRANGNKGRRRKMFCCCTVIW